MMMANVYESNGRLLLEHVPLKKLIAEKGQQKEWKICIQSMGADRRPFFVYNPDIGGI